MKQISRLQRIFAFITLIQSFHQRRIIVLFFYGQTGQYFNCFTSKSGGQLHTSSAGVSSTYLSSISIMLFVLVPYLYRSSKKKSFQLTSDWELNPVGLLSLLSLACWPIRPVLLTSDGEGDIVDTVTLLPRVLACSPFEKFSFFIRHIIDQTSFLLSINLLSLYNQSLLC